MRNYWRTDDDALVEWVADLSVALHRPANLLTWLQTVIEVGEEQQVYTVHDAPLLSYIRERDGAVADVVAAHLTRTGQLDLFYFTESGMQVLDGRRYTAAAHLAYYDEAGRLTTADVDDLGMLLRRLSPRILDEAPWMATRVAPLSVQGPLINTRHPQDSIMVWKGTTIQVRFRLRSDIWLPWVKGLTDETHDLHKRFDNRALAHAHTPRLNRFFEVVRTATETLGGRWYLDEDRDSLRVDRFLVDNTGIRLDTDLPPTLSINQGDEAPDPLATRRERMANIRRQQGRS